MAQEQPPPEDLAMSMEKIDKLVDKLSMENICKLADRFYANLTAGLIPKLSDSQKQALDFYFSKTWRKQKATDATKLMHYIQAYLLVDGLKNDPLKVNRITNENAKIATAAIGLNITLEEAVYPGPEPIDNSTVNERTYWERGGVSYLRQGDILPGGRYEFGRPDTYKKGILSLDKSSPELYGFLTNARLIGNERHKEISKGEYEEAAKKIYGLFKPLQKEEDKGEGYRKRAAWLQLAFQEAGIESRFVQGGFVDTTNFRRPCVYWVEVKRGIYDADYLLFFDPTWNLAGEKGGIHGEESYTAFKLKYFELTYSHPNKFNRVWRPIFVEFSK